MEGPNASIRLEAAVQILNEVSVHGEANMIRLISVIKELKDVAKQLREQEEVAIEVVDNPVDNNAE